MVSEKFDALDNGLLELSDKDLIQEAKSYTRHDLIENIKDPRLTTRHFDLLIALCIAWQMRHEARANKINTIRQEEPEVLYNEIGI